MKLGVCIPYRDVGDGVREEHLKTLIPHLEKFLSEKDIEFRCYIGHQVDDKKFNRSGTKNVAFLAAKEDGCDYVAFHDVDMLPHDDVDYSHPGETPKQIANILSQWDYTLRDIEYFGGVVLFTIEQFEKVNGYHTNYWGWGMEDDDLFWRCYQKGYFKHKEIEGLGSKKVIQFDGHSTYIEIPSTRTLKMLPHSGFKMQFYLNPQLPNEEDEYLIGNRKQKYEKYPILCKNGWDFDICYNNAKALSTSLWSWKNEHLYSWVRRYPNLWTKLDLDVSPKKGRIRFTVNDIVYDEKFGEQCSTIKLDDRLKRYPPIPFYIGRNAPNAWMGIKNFFKGEIAIVKFWNDRGDLILHYDFDKSWKGMRIEDLSGNGNHGNFISGDGGRITKRNIEIIKDTLIPDRRFGTMECLEHEDEGIDKNTKRFAGDNEATSRNEIIYRMKMQKDKIDVDKDEYGLKEMKYEIVDTEEVFGRHLMVNARF